MKYPWTRISTVVLAVCAFACLEPPDESVPLAVVLGDPMLAEDISRSPDFAQREPELTRNVAYLRGFAEGRAIWFWSVDGANSELVAPSYFVVDDQGQPAQGAAIIDVLPGDTGYTPWWRVVEYVTTDLYAGEVFTSREALDAAAAAGLLDGPFETERVINAPVSARRVEVFDGEITRTNTSTVWYRGFRAHWLPFERNLRLPTDQRTMRVLPVYILQRINEAIPLSEPGAGVDLNGDNALNATNNIFALDFDDPEYSPLWRPMLVRTYSDYVSFDSVNSSSVGFTRESQVYDRMADMPTTDVLSIEAMGGLGNCPIQSRRGNVP